MKKLMLLLMILTGSFLAGAQQSSIGNGLIATYARNLVTTYASSGFGLPSRSAGLLSKIGWRLTPQQKQAATPTGFSAFDRALICDAYPGVLISNEQNLLQRSCQKVPTNNPVTIRQKGSYEAKSRSRAGIKLPPIEKHGPESTVNNILPLVSGCDLYK